MSDVKDDNQTQRKVTQNIFSYFPRGDYTFTQYK